MSEYPVIPPGILAKVPKAKHRDELEKFDVSELLKMDNKTLAQWQSCFEQGEPQWKLAEHEWQSAQEDLQEKLQ